MESQQPVPDLNVFPSYKGGSTTTYGGYVYEFLPTHPLANRWGWVAQHRLVGEALVGRPLVQHTDPAVRECVHHINETRTDNRPENLEVLSFSAHRRHHAKKMNMRREASLTDEIVRKALHEHGGIAQAARALCVHHQTLRNRFPAAIDPYKRSSPVDLQNTQYREQLLEVARYFAPTTMSYAGLAKLTHVCAKAWLKLCVDHGIHWSRGPTGGRGRRLTYRGQPTRYAVERGVT